ncbi:hypothetical protein UNPF46_11530 [Bradyrhizobium sp. UNPF46]|uniref:hypothetical protein n=1 Tax=Bradyrhizobium sp. UNPF46 TaxID=1141168 RepID=UPI00114F61B5|nr:hypothetical protein [Bradyrhizobium sp. UNPF46]TQF40088.1 hypothetical protein UNPF46_11530 [Bradyrhizobium sp. UNPF46]
MDDLETGFSLMQKRQLLQLKKWLERQRAYKEKIEWLEGILADQGRSEDHKRALNVLEDYKRRLANANEAIDLSIHVLGLIDKTFDLEKQLAEILEDQL